MTALWLNRLGVAIAAASLVIGIWLQLLGQVGGLAGHLVLALDALFALGIGALLVAAAELLAMMQSRARDGERTLTP